VEPARAGRDPGRAARRRHADWDRGDFVLSPFVRFHPVYPYDQAGLIVRLSAECWLKTSVEYEPDGPNRLGAVALRVRREGADYSVEYAGNATTAWSQIRIAPRQVCSWQSRRARSPLKLPKSAAGSPDRGAARPACP
jgi:regulation of enolase protein 1 (concanavalin A-like superfamily)